MWTVKDMPEPGPEMKDKTMAWGGQAIVLSFISFYDLSCAPV